MKPLFTVLLTLSASFVFAQDPVQLNDFATNGASTFRFDPEIEGLTTETQLFFIADNGKTGEELWRSNGTSAGTQLLKDIRPGEENSNINFYTTIGNITYFGANDGEHGYELWKTQGTTSSTQMVKDLNPGSAGSISGRHAVLNDVLYFAANAGDKGTELYRTEGTEASTQLVKDINPKIRDFSNLPFSSNLQKFAPAQHLIYFVANDGEHGNELWKTDGTAGGTVLVKDITEGNGSTNFSQLKTENNTLCFVANDGVHGNELWISLGSEATTYMVKDITEGEESSTIEILGVVNDIIYFTIKESVFRRLWKSDGTEEGTEMVLDEDGDDINVRAFIPYKNQLFLQGNFRLWKVDGTDEGTEEISDVSIEGEFAIMNDSLYFIGHQGTDGQGLWKTDGTAEGTVAVKENITSASFREIDHLTAGTNHVFFIAETDEFGRELWTSDGTEAGTFMLIDSKPGEEDGFRSYEDVTFYTVGGKLLFAGFDEAHGRELWGSDGTEAGTTLVKDIKTQSEDIQLYSNPVPLGNHTYFSTEEGLWQTDGTAENTVLIKELVFAFGLNVFQDKLFFTAESEENNRRIIWTSDGTEEGTAPLFEVTPESGKFFQFQQSLPQINGELFFSGRDSLGSELWKTDGTEAGTVRVKDINEGTDDSFFSFNDDYIIVNDILYFVASDNLLGNELWKTDGTEAGTVPVSDINPFSSSSPRGFTEVDGTIFFSADDGTGGRELWKSDGTTEGTVLVKDIFPGDEDDDGLNTSASFINFQGTLYFAANDGENGRELWKSDGTEAGTVMVKDIFPPDGNFTKSSNPNNFFVHDNALYFAAGDESGRKIWKSDGTADGTQPYTSLEASFNTRFFEANGNLFFNASNDETGEEIWKIGKSNEPVPQVYDIVPGTLGSSPYIYGYHSDVLYFLAEDDVRVRELWALAPLQTEIQFEASRTEICTSEDSVTFTATATNAGTNPKYEWYINEQVVILDNGGRVANFKEETLSTNGLKDGDEVKVLVIVDEEVWTLQDSVFTETITINFSELNPKITIAGNKLTASEGAGYQWFFEGEPLPDTTNTIIAAASGSYKVEISNESGCIFLSDEVEVIVCTVEKPTIQIENFTITSSEAATYKWLLNGEALPDTTQTIEAKESGNYQVEITDAQGCTAVSDVVEIDLCSNFTATLTQEGTTLTASEGISYKWLLNGEELPDETQSIEAEESGTYQVEVTDSLGCVVLSESLEITVTGIEDEILARQLSMYPNPATSQLKIAVQTHEEVQLFIYNTAGKQVHESMLTSKNDSYEIPLHNLRPGIYLVRFIGEKGTHQKKLIKH